jgi:hypothetical protein
MVELIGIYLASWLLAFGIGRFVYRTISQRHRLFATALVVAVIVAPGGVAAGHGFSIVPLPVAVYNSNLYVLKDFWKFNGLSLLTTFIIVWVCLIAKRRWSRTSGESDDAA